MCHSVIFLILHNLTSKITAGNENSVGHQSPLQLRAALVKALPISKGDQIAKEEQKTLNQQKAHNHLRLEGRTAARVGEIRGGVSSNECSMFRFLLWIACIEFMVSTREIIFA